MKLKEIFGGSVKAAVLTGAAGLVVAGLFGVPVLAPVVAFKVAATGAAVGVAGVVAINTVLGRCADRAAKSYRAMFPYVGK